MTHNTSRLVITGMGVVSPLGVGTDRSWKRLLAGQSGIRALEDTKVSDVAAKIAGVVPTLTEDSEGGFDPDSIITRKDQKKMDRFTQFAIAATHEAVTQANWFPRDETQRQRSATIIATGVGGFHAVRDAILTTEKRGARRLSPFTIPAFLANLAAGWVSIINGFKGPLGAPVTACAAGVQAIGDAARLIRAGEADIAVCGGAEACIDRVSLGGFAAARALSTRFNEHPALASRPFDKQRDGFVMSEGAGVVVLESLDHATTRGAKPLAELVGYGTSADAFHLTASPEGGEGAQRSMKLALTSAGLEPMQIDHINAHSTSTPLGDAAELSAITEIFGRGKTPLISATKSSTGHLLGAAGGLEAIFSILALRDQTAPPTINYDEGDALSTPLNIVGKTPVKHLINHVLSNGFGFGGVNASVIFKRYAA